jgi:hypothetical protein
VPITSAPNQQLIAMVLMTRSFKKKSDHGRLGVSPSEALRRSIEKLGQAKYG